MVLAELEKTLNRVEVTFNKIAAGLQPLAQSLTPAASLCLSRILLGTIAFGVKTPDERAVSACRALEFLDQALGLDASASSDTGCDEAKLLVADYLYGQAIDQVIDAGEPGVIDVLARAIAGSAEDKIHNEDSRYSVRLITAAFDIALLLGEFNYAGGAAVKAAREAAAGGDVDWPTALPVGQITKFMQASTSVATSN